MINRAVCTPRRKDLLVGLCLVVATVHHAAAREEPAADPRARADQLYALGEYKAAAKEYKRSARPLKGKPGAGASYYWLGRCYQALDKPRNADKAFRTAADLLNQEAASTDRVEVFYCLGSLARDAGDLAALCAMSRRAVEGFEDGSLKAGSSADYFQLGIAYWGIGADDRYAELLKKSIAARTAVPPLPPALHLRESLWRLAERYLKNGRASLARHCLRHAAPLASPRSPDLPKLAARCLEAGDEELALSLWRRGAQAEPPSFGCFPSLVLRHFARGEWPEALKLASEAASEFRNRAEPFRWLAVGHTLTGDEKRARAALDRAVKLDPEGEETVWLQRLFRALDGGFLSKTALRRLLEAKLTRRTDPDHAANLLEQAAKESPSSGRVLLELARVYSEHGIHEEAAALLTKAVERDPALATASALLGDAYEQLGQMAAARDAWLRAAALEPAPVAALLGLARYFEQRNDLQVSSRYYEKVAVREPTSVTRSRDAALRLFRAGQEHTAQQRLREYVRLALQHEGRVPDPELVLALLNGSLNTSAYALLHKAQHISSTQPEEAARLYGQVLELALELAAARRSLGRLLVTLGRLEEAREHLAAGAIADRDGEACRLLGVLSLRKNEPGEALEWLGAASKFAPASAKVHVCLSAAEWARAGKVAGPALSAFLDAMEKEGSNLGQAIAGYRKAMAATTAFPAAQTRLGSLLLVRRDVKNALAAAQQAVATAPHWLEARKLLARGLTAHGDGEAAHEAWAKVVELAPEDAGALAELALSAEALDRLEEATKVYQRLVLLEPMEPQYHTALGNMLFALGRYPEAQAAYAWGYPADEDSLALDRANLTRHVVAGKLPPEAAVLLRKSVGEEKADARLPLAAQAVEAAPTSVLANAQLAELYRAQRKYEPALKHWDAATQSVPGRAQLWTQLADTAMHLGRFERARDAYLRAAALMDDDRLVRPLLKYAKAGIAGDLTPEAFRIFISMADSQSGRLEKCAQVMRACPRFAPAYVEAANLFRADSKWKEAIPIAEKAAQLDPEGTRVLLASVRLHQGKPAEAIELLETAAADRPRNHWIYGALGAARAANGDTEGAIAAYQESLRLGAPGKRYHELATMYARAGKPDRRKLTLQTGYEETTLPGFLKELGTLYFEARNYARAVAVFRQLRQAYPEDGTIATNLRDARAFHDGLVTPKAYELARAGFALAKKEPRKAIANFEAALKLCPEYDRFVPSLLNLYLSQKQFASAAKLGRSKLARFEGDKHFLNVLAVAVVNLNDPKEARPYAEKALALDRQFAAAKSTLQLIKRYQQIIEQQARVETLFANRGRMWQSYYAPSTPFQRFLSRKEKYVVWYPANWKVAQPAPRLVQFQGPASWTIRLSSVENPARIPLERLTTDLVTNITRRRPKSPHAEKVMRRSIKLAGGNAEEVCYAYFADGVRCVRATTLVLTDMDRNIYYLTFTSAAINFPRGEAYFRYFAESFFMFHETNWSEDFEAIRKQLVTREPATTLLYRRNALCAGVAETDDPADTARVRLARLCAKRPELLADAFLHPSFRVRREIIKLVPPEQSALLALVALTDSDPTVFQWGLERARAGEEAILAALPGLLRPPRRPLNEIASHFTKKLLGQHVEVHVPKAEYASGLIPILSPSGQLKAVQTLLHAPSDLVTVRALDSIRTNRIAGAWAAALPLLDHPECWMRTMAINALEVLAPSPIDEPRPGRFLPEAAERDICQIILDGLRGDVHATTRADFAEGLAFLGGDQQEAEARRLLETLRAEHDEWDAERKAQPDKEWPSKTLEAADQRWHLMYTLHDTLAKLATRKRCREVGGEALADGASDVYAGAWALELRYRARREQGGEKPVGLEEPQDYAALVPHGALHYWSAREPARVVTDFYDKLETLELATRVPALAYRLRGYLSWFRHAIRLQGDHPTELAKEIGIDLSAPMAFAEWKPLLAPEGYCSRPHSAMICRVTDRDAFYRFLYEATLGRYRPSRSTQNAMDEFMGAGFVPALLPFEIKRSTLWLAKPARRPYDIRLPQHVDKWVHRERLSLRGVPATSFVYRDINTNALEDIFQNSCMMFGDVAVVSLRLEALEDLLAVKGGEVKSLRSNPTFADAAGRHQREGAVLYYSDLESQARLRERAREAAKKKGMFKEETSPVGKVLDAARQPIRAIAGHLEIASPTGPLNEYSIVLKDGAAKRIFQSKGPAPIELKAPLDLVPSSVTYYLGADLPGLGLDPGALWKWIKAEILAEPDRESFDGLWKGGLAGSVLPHLSGEVAILCFEIPLLREKREEGPNQWAIAVRLRDARLSQQLRQGRLFAEGVNPPPVEKAPEGLHARQVGNFVIASVGEYLVLCDRPEVLDKLLAPQKLTTNASFLRARGGAGLDPQVLLYVDVNAAQKELGDLLPKDPERKSRLDYPLALLDVFTSQIAAIRAENGKLTCHATAALDIPKEPAAADITGVLKDEGAVKNSILVEKRIENTDKLESITLELTMEPGSVKIDDFLLPSKRVAVEKKAEGDYLVTVSRQAAPARKPLELPILERPELQEHLWSTRDINAKDPKIVNLARLVVGAETDSYRAAKRLLRWVHQNLRYRKVGYSDSVQILETREGCCVEYSRLFAALLRSIGIPARLCSGVMYADRVFGAHSWVEVYLGEWIEMDPTAGQYLADATHIKLDVPIFVSYATFGLMRMKILEVAERKGK